MYNNIEVSILDYIDRLISLREDNDIEQKALAELLGITQSAYSKYEQRRCKMSIEDLIKLCKYYNVSADHILGLK